jgi:superfamily II DNA helicase RecQ
MSPEIAVAAEWNKAFTSAYVKLKLTLIAEDEAHCIAK